MIKQETPSSPFKFLDAYLKEDKDEFFGRKAEINELYRLVSRHRFVVVYGKIGTGKTSLVMCGLANCFEETDWFALYVRRGNNFLEAMARSLVACGIRMDSESVKAIEKGLIALIKQKLRPVYIIFDQFEELLILGDDQEKKDAYRLIRSILSNEKLASCNQIVTIREEYFGSLELLVKDTPRLLDARLPLRPMDRKQVMEVIRQSGPKYNITFEDNAIERMVDILQDQSDISLPYLQVYMDQLWRRDFERTYPQGLSKDMGLPYLHWEVKEIEESGALKDVLQRFLHEQLELIGKELDLFLVVRPDITHPFGNTQDLLDEILDALVTAEGTKYPLEVSSDMKGIKLGDSATQIFKGFEPRLLEEVLSLLESHRIVRKEIRYVELAHDKIAELIYQKRTQLIGEQNDLKVIIDQVQKDENRSYLSNNDINRFEKIIGRLDHETRGFIELSKKANRRFKIWKWVFAVVVVFLLLFGAGLWQYGILRKGYRKLYAEAFYGSRFDKFPNKALAINIAKYLYDKQESEENKKELLPSYLKLFRNPSVQSMLSTSLINIKGEGLRPFEFDISDEGGYISGRIGDSGYRFQLWNNKGDSVTTFDRIKYMYFIQGTDLLFLANRNRDTTSLLAEQSNSFVIYDCKHKKVHLQMKLDNRYLYTYDNFLEDDWSRDDSYRVRYLSDGKLIVPTRKVGDGLSRQGEVLIVSPNGKTERVNGHFSVSNSTDRKWIMTGRSEANSKGLIEIYNPSNVKKPIFSISNASFGDFTPNNSAVYLKGNEILLTKLNGVPINVVPNVSGAVRVKVDERARYAITENANHIFTMYDFLTKKPRITEDKLEGVDFARTRVLLNKVLKNNKEKSQFRFEGFDGKLFGSFGLDSAIVKTVFNPATGDVLVMDKAFRLWLLNGDSKLKAVYQLTPNDFFGFTANGKYIYYVRDTMLNILENKQNMVNLSDVKQAGDWLLEKEKLKNMNIEVTPEIVKKYDLPGKWLL